MLPSELTLSALRFILSAKSGQSCEQDSETVDFCNSLTIGKGLNHIYSAIEPLFLISLPTSLPEFHYKCCAVIARD